MHDNVAVFEVEEAISVNLIMWRLLPSNVVLGVIFLALCTKHPNLILILEEPWGRKNFSHLNCKISGDSLTILFEYVYTGIMCLLLNDGDNNADDNNK